MSKLKVWETEKYYNIAAKASSDFEHPAMVQLTKLAKESKNILDLGCGEGTRLSKIKTKAKKTGVDISKTAIKNASKKHNKINFEIANLEKLPYKDNQFDLIFSAYVLEHTLNPEKILREASRVLKKKGKLLLVAPNYGSPNRSSPPAKYSRIRKLFINFCKDFLYKSNDLNWTKVKPLTGEYFPDSDTTIEPYLYSLERFLKNKLNMRLVLKSSLWEEELPTAKIHQKIFKLLSDFKVFPFYYWGPHLYIIVQK